MRKTDKMEEEMKKKSNKSKTIKKLRRRR